MKKIKIEYNENREIEKIEILDESDEKLVEQQINPTTGTKFKNEEEIVEFFKTLYPEEDFVFDIETPDIKTFVSVYIVPIDATVNSIEDLELNSVKYLYKGKEYKIHLIVQIDPENKIKAPFSQLYIAPYYMIDSTVPAGTVKFDVKNGESMGYFKPTQSGIFEIRPEKIYKLGERGNLVPTKGFPEFLNLRPIVVVEG